MMGYMCKGQGRKVVRWLVTLVTSSRRAALCGKLSWRNQVQSCWKIPAALKG